MSVAWLNKPWINSLSIGSWNTKSYVVRRCMAFLLLNFSPRFVCFCLGISSPWVKLVRISNSPSLFTFAANSWGMLEDLKLPSRFLMKHRLVCWRFRWRLTYPRSRTSCWVFEVVIGLLDAILALCLHEPILMQTTFACLFFVVLRVPYWWNSVLLWGWRIGEAPKPYK
jgi:hypothetical protein